MGLLIASLAWQAAHNLNTLDFFIRERPAPVLYSATTTSHHSLGEKWTMLQHNSGTWNSHLLHHQVPRSHKYKYNHCNPPVITNKMIPRTDLWHGQGVLGNLIKTYNLTFQKYLYLLLLSHKYLFRMIHLFFSGKQLYDKYNFKVSIIFSF